MVKFRTMNTAFKMPMKIWESQRRMYHTITNTYPKYFSPWNLSNYLNTLSIWLLLDIFHSCPWYISFMSLREKIHRGRNPHIFLLPYFQYPGMAYNKYLLADKLNKPIISVKEKKLIRPKIHQQSHWFYFIYIFIFKKLEIH